MDGCAPTIPKHVPQRNLSLCGKNTPMSLMRLVVCFDGQILHTVTVSPPSSSNAHPVPHASFSTFYSFHNLLLYSSGYLVILILFLSFSPAFCRPVAFARLPVSPLPLPPLPAFSLVFTHHCHSTGIQIPVPKICFSLPSRSKDLYFPFPFYYVTPSQYYSTGCPAHITLSPTPHHPLVFTYNRHSTGI